MSWWDNIKYFIPSEFDSPDAIGSGRNMDREFIERLDKARGYAGIPFKINSGFRTKTHNRKVGGKITSSHLKYCAADIHAVSGYAKSKIINALVKAGLGRRIGVADTFIHVDSDKDKGDAFWTYPPKQVKTKKTSWWKRLLKTNVVNTKETVKIPPYTASVQFIKSGKNTDWSHEFYKIKELHDAGFKGKGVRIAVLDTGCDITHNSFAKAISEGRLRAIDARRGKNDPNDVNGHGTWCVSRYISEGNDVLGFAPECTVTSYKVLNDDGSGSLDDVMRGVRMAINAGHHIISTSLGWTGNVQGFNDLVEECKDKGIVFISAAGNDGTREDIDYPALYNYVLSIGSHNERLKRSRFSDYGHDLDFYSSGENVLGAYTNNREAYLDGTSMATPSFGALLALVYFQLREENGKLFRRVFRKIASCQ